MGTIKQREKYERAERQEIARHIMQCNVCIILPYPEHYSFTLIPQKEYSDHTPIIILLHLGYEYSEQHSSKSSDTWFPGKLSTIYEHRLFLAKF